MLSYWQMKIAVFAPKGKLKELMARHLTKERQGPLGLPCGRLQRLQGLDQGHVGEILHGHDGATGLRRRCAAGLSLI